MKDFDCIIMNPPYDGSTHLKILDNVISEFPEAEVVNLSPTRWIDDPLAEYKKSSDFKKFENIRNHIGSLDYYKAIEMQRLFAAGLPDIGIYKITKKGGYVPQYKGMSIIKKVWGHESFLDKVEANQIDGWRVRVNELRPIVAGDGRTNNESWRWHIINLHVETYVYKDGYTKSGKYWTQLSAHGKYFNKTDSLLPLSIKFNTEQEAFNFESYCKLKLPLYLKRVCQKDQHVPLRVLPFMPSYKDIWTDQKLYEYFNLTPDEIEEIESTVQ